MVSPIGHQPEKYNLPKKSVRLASIALLIFATVTIFSIAELINGALAKYEIQMLFISFCVGFILFTPLVSLVLHPFALQKNIEDNQSYKSTLMANIGLVIFVQFLFFLIWMTDAIAVYSIYVDQTSFLSQAFNITGNNKGGFSTPFLIFNVVLAVIFSALSLAVGVLPCLFARLNNHGVVGNFVASFSFVKKNKIMLLMYSLAIATSVLLPLLTIEYLFLVCFPLTLFFVIINISRRIC